MFTSDLNSRHHRVERLRSLSISTPHLEYDGGVAVQALEALMRGLDSSRATSAVHLAVKSCYCRPLLELFAARQVGAEVMSDLEYRYARSCGFNGPDIILNGLGRSEKVLRQAMSEGATIIVDSEGDYQAISRIVASGFDGEVTIGLRVKLDLGSRRGARYGAPGSKLGLDHKSMFFREVLEWALERPSVRLDMIHIHVAMNEVTSDLHRSALEQLAEIVRILESEWPGLFFERVNLGGGFGTFLDDEYDVAVKLFKEVGALFISSLPGRTLVLEPGRYLTNRAGAMVGTVVDLKRDQADRVIAVSDIGTNVLIPNPAARYTLEHPRCVTGTGVPFMLVDGITSPDNVVVTDVEVDSVPEIGDRVVVGSCGAYTHVFAHIWAYDLPTVSYRDPAGKDVLLFAEQDAKARRSAELGFAEKQATTG